MASARLRTTQPVMPRSADERISSSSSSVTARVLERLRNPKPETDSLAQLTPQERRILDLIAEGRTNRQIAEAMFLAEKTVKNYVSSVFSKLGMERRTQAAAYAARVFGENERPTGDE